MIPYGKQDISQADIDAVVEVLRSDWLTQGPTVPKFEHTVASYCGSKFAVAVSNATAALHIACLSLDVGVGDWVWTTPNTFVATANCALYCGANIDFVDIDPDTFNMSVERLAYKLANVKKDMLPKVVIPVHLCGQSCDMAAIRLLAEKYGFRIIEDASHAIGGRYRNERVGNCYYSDITVVSFHPVKIITTGEGGMALTNNPNLFERMQNYRSHGITNDRRRMHPRYSDEIWNYQQIVLGYNYRMTDIQAALGISQMMRLNKFVERRREIAKKYDDRLSNLPIIIPKQHPDTYSSYHLYPIRIQLNKYGKTQQQVYDLLTNAGIKANLHYIPVYLHPYYKSLGFQKGYCPVSEQYFKEAISLPIFPSLSADEHDYIIETLNRGVG